MEKTGVLHDPTFNTLRGYKPLGRPKGSKKGDSAASKEA